MKIPIVQRNEKKNPFWREVTKPRTDLVLRKNCDNCERGAVSNKAVFVKYCPDFKVRYCPDFKGFWGNSERNVKYYFTANVLY